MCLLHVESQNKLRLMASITVCSSQIHCIATIPQVTPKQSVNAEEYFRRSFSASETCLVAMPYLAGHDSRFESISSYGGGMDSDSDMVSSECSNNNVLDDGKKLRHSNLFGSSESVQTLIGISESEEPGEDQRPNRTSTGTLLGDEAVFEKKKKKTVRQRRSSLQHEPKSVPLPRRHFSLTAKIQQAEKDFSSLQDINRSTSVPTVGQVVSNLQQQDAGSNSSLGAETNFSFAEGPVSELGRDKQAVCPPDKLIPDEPRPQSPLKKFIRLLSPTTPHRTISSSPMVQHRALSHNTSVQSSSRLSEYMSTPKHDTVHTMRPKSVSTTNLEPVHYQQRASTLGRDLTRKQFSPMTLKPAHIKEGNGQTLTSSQKSLVGSSQMWLGTEDKW